MSLLDLSTIPTLIIASLAVFRLAYLVTKESGPMFVFLKLRKEAKKQGGSVAEGAQCPHCMGMWMSILVMNYLLISPRIKLIDNLIIILAAAGFAMIIHQLFVFLRRE